MWYVRLLENIDGVHWFKRIFGIITVKDVGNKTIAILPYKADDKISDKKWAKLANKLSKKLYDKQNQSIVLAEDIRQNESFVNTLNSNNCNILCGRWLFSYLTEEVLEYIEEKSEKQLETMEIAVMVNDNSERNLKIIVNLAQRVKMLNIVTNHIEKFKKIEEYLYEKMGILVRITNNTKKALLKTDVILNMDFPEELVNRYVLPKKGILVNIDEKVTIFTKRFSGININSYEIALPEEYYKFFEENNLIENFNTSILYESMLHRRSSYDSIRKQIRDNKSKIKNLIGINGIICEKEYKEL